MFHRSQWGSKFPVGGYPLEAVVKEVIVHHYYLPDVSPASSVAQEMSVLRGVERYHYAQGWGGATGYNFHVMPSGRIYEGRGWFRIGAHTAGRNSKSVGIALGFNGDMHALTAEMINAVVDIVREGIAVRALTDDHSWAGHCDYAAKSCPGSRVYKDLSVFREVASKGDQEMTEGQKAEILHRTQLIINGAMGARDAEQREQTRLLRELVSAVGGLTEAVKGSVGDGAS